MGTDSYKRFPSQSWSLFEDLLKTRLSGISGSIAELQLKINKPDAAGVADSLATKREIDGVEFDGSGSVSHYGICNTAGNTATKVVACTGFKLVTGAEITVRFDVANTAEGAISLNVNNTGAIPIKYHGVPVTGSETLLEDYTYTFKYNGTWFEVVGSLGTMYDVFGQATDQEAGEAGLVPAPAIGNTGGTYLNSNGTWSTPINTTYSDFIPATGDSAGVAGLVPAPRVGDGSAKFLNANGSWETPAGTTYTGFTGATNNADGEAGLVPAPNSGDENKFLKADGTWANPVDSDTTYNVFTGASNNSDGSSGLVTPPVSGEESMFLRGDGTWAIPAGTDDPFTGATSEDDGVTGLVPAPTAGDQDGKFLKADGTWSIIPEYHTFTTSTSLAAGQNGLVPGPAVGDDGTKFLAADGTWKVPVDTNTTYVPFVAATASAAGTAGLVPAPAAGDDATKFLNAAGSWVVPSVATHTTNGYMSSQDKIDLDNFYHQTNKAYSVGEQVHVPGQPNYLVLECIQAGVTGATAPDFDESGYPEYATNTAYSVGDQVRVPGQPSYLVLECQVAGTSGSTAPNFN